MAAKHIGDPREAVRNDVALLRNSFVAPGALVSSGVVYDVDTGRVEVIVSPLTSD
ncbi:Uncharacterised protein [Mycobacterium tuberculosis]|nr:Uncharacterised protein [Mycobacterium tuberculosis]